MLSKRKSGSIFQFICWSQLLKNRLHLDKSLYNILQVMSVSVFENMRLIQLLDFSEIKPVEPAMPIQLNLFDNLMGH